VVLGPSRLASKEINARFNTYKDERLKDMAKEAKESIDQGVKILPTVSQAMSILRTNENIRTGNVAANELRFFKRNLEILLTGKPSEVTEALDTLNAISNQLAPLMRMKGSGSTSDMEFQAYRDAILSLGNTAIANYVSLYALRKKIENSIQLFELERRMLLSDDVESMDQITQAMKEVDQGIIEKYTGPDDAESYNNFLAALPEGAVIDNFDRLFEKYNPELPEMGAFVIKGWKGGRR
jgi:hypothetical protein